MFSVQLQIGLTELKNRAWIYGQEDDLIKDVIWSIFNFFIVGLTTSDLRLRSLEVNSINYNRSKILKTKTLALIKNPSFLGFELETWNTQIWSPASNLGFFAW